MLTVDCAEFTVYEVEFCGYRYGVTFAHDRIGVVRYGCGKIKYMPVTLDYRTHYFPRMLKTKLPCSSTARELVETLVACSRLHCSMLECVTLCEHILAHGRTPR